MSTNPSEIFIEPRIRILKAVQNNELKTVEDLLLTDQTLINSKTTTKGSSLLHIAATCGHEALCKLLDKYHHETNPVDKDGQTPYQRAASATVKSIIVLQHLNYLRDTFYTSLQIPAPNKPFIESIAREIFTANREDFPHLHPEKDKGNSAFATSILSRDITTPATDKNYILTTIFREDVLMTPYYGELITIHENEQAIQHIETLANSKNGFFGTRGEFPISETPRIEARAYLKHISSALVLYPFLNKYPHKDDKPEIAEAKKLFIAFSLAGFVGYICKCTPSQLQHLQETMPCYGTVHQHVTETIYGENSEESQSIINHMHTKLTSKERVKDLTIPGMFTK